MGGIVGNPRSLRDACAVGTRAVRAARRCSAVSRGDRGGYARDTGAGSLAGPAGVRFSLCAPGQTSQGQAPCRLPALRHALFSRQRYLVLRAIVARSESRLGVRACQRFRGTDVSRAGLRPGVLVCALDDQASTLGPARTEVAATAAKEIQ